MERQKYLLAVTWVLLSGFVTYGQTNPSIYRAYITGQMSSWKAAIDSMESIHNKSNHETLNLLNYQYGYIGWCIGQKQTGEAEAYLMKAMTNLNNLEKKNHEISLLYAYKSAFIGFEIGISPYKAPFIGHKSLYYANMSLSLDSTNTLAIVQLGNIAYYTPKFLGGSKTKAMPYYMKALHLMEKQLRQNLREWNYLNLLAIIVNGYNDIGQPQIAKKYCLKALAVEPEFEWIKKHLYPQTLQKISTNE